MGEKMDLNKTILKLIKKRNEMTISEILCELEKKPGISESDIGYFIWNLIGRGQLTLTTNRSISIPR